MTTTDDGKNDLWTNRRGISSEYRNDYSIEAIPRRDICSDFKPKDYLCHVLKPKTDLEDFRYMDSQIGGTS